MMGLKDQTVQVAIADQDRVEADREDLDPEAGVDRVLEAVAGRVVLDQEDLVQVVLDQEVADQEVAGRVVLDQEDLVQVVLDQEVADQVAPGQEDLVLVDQDPAVVGREDLDREVADQAVLDQEVADQEVADQAVLDQEDLDREVADQAVQVRVVLVRVDQDLVDLDREEVDQVGVDRADQALVDLDREGVDPVVQVLVADRAREAGVDLGVVPGQGVAGHAGMESSNRGNNVTMETRSITTTAQHSVSSLSAGTASPTKIRRSAMT